MDDLYKLLQEIRPRPELYIGKPSLERLFAFLNGYRHHNSYDVNANDCLDGFNQYVAERYGMNTDHNWSSIIQFFCINGEKEAFDEFYKLLDEFMESKR